MKTVLITGGTGKLGQAFLRGFAASGWSVAFTSRSAADAEPLRRACLEQGAPQAVCLEVDLSEEGAAASVVRAAEAHGLAITALVNNARNLAFLRPDSDGLMPRGSWHGEFTLGVIAPYELTMALARSPAATLRSVVNVASIYGITAPNLRVYDDPPRQSPANYGVVKAALIHLTKELAVRLAPAVRVNAVSYGGVDGRVDDAFRQRYAALSPSGRMLDESEVFGPAYFLVSDASAGMTGHNLVADGGWTIW